MMRRFVSGMFLALFVVAICGAAMAQDDTEYSYGTVVSVSSTELVVSEYDYDTDAEANVTYNLDPAANAKDLKAGDSVEVYYILDGEKRVAKSVSIEEQTGETEEIEIQEKEADTDM